MKKGFATSGILYTILLLFMALMFGVLQNLQNKKTILDELKRETVNAISCNGGDVTVISTKFPADKFSQPIAGYQKVIVILGAWTEYGIDYLVDISLTGVGTIKKDLNYSAKGTATPNAQVKTVTYTITNIGSDTVVNLPATAYYIIYGIK